MEYDYAELVYIERVVNEGNIEKAKQQFQQLERQQFYLFTEDDLYKFITY